LDLFRPRKGKKAAAPADRTPFRPRVEDALREMGSSPPDAAARLATLRTLTPRLETLFRDHVAAGAPPPTTQKLGETLERLHALIAQPGPADADVHAVWDALAAALRDWLAADAPTEAKRGDWWK